MLELPLSGLYVPLLCNRGGTMRCVMQRSALLQSLAVAAHGVAHGRLEWRRARDPCFHHRCGSASGGGEQNQRHMCTRACTARVRAS